MTGEAHERDWQVLQSEDIAFLQKTRGDLQALLDTGQRWTELIRSLTRSIPRENGKFGQDPLGRGLLAGITPGEVDTILTDTKSQQRLETLIAKIDEKIAALTHEQSSAAGELPAQRQKPAA